MTMRIICLHPRLAGLTSQASGTIFDGLEADPIADAIAQCVSDLARSREERPPETPARAPRPWHGQNRAVVRRRRASDGRAGGTSEVEFALLVERGPLEAQSLLLVESLRRFGGRHRASPVTAASPRPSRRPSRGTIRALRRLGAEYVALDLAGACPAYPTSWRVHALAVLESRPGPEVIVQLDSDTLFLGDVGPLCVGAQASARPVDVKGMASTGPGDAFDPYWSALCGLAGVELESLSFVRTTVDGTLVRATHNGGFVAARRANRLFARAEELFRRSVDADLRPHAGSGLNIAAGTGDVGLAGSEWWGSSQAAMSVAATSLGIAIEPLHEWVNVPVHLWAELKRKPESVIHAHYHSILGAPLARANPLLDGSVALTDDVAAWLRSRVPLATGTGRWK
jgi:hypothetical protein